MGIEIRQDHFSEQDFAHFNAKIRDNLKALQQLLEQPGFGVGEDSLGAELEFYLVDAGGNPVPCNQAILKAAGNPQLTPELNRFNLEYNLQPQPFRGRPFSGFEQELQTAIDATNRVAEPLGAQLLPIGILPTVTLSQFGAHMMTDQPRYRAMDNALRRLRGAPFEVHIDGTPPLNLTWDDVTLEGANTSFQLHWRLNPEHFANSFNAVQLITPIALALAANSPLLFGHELWQETRIALFKQSIDCRDENHAQRKYPPRVYFGNGWLRQGALELFASSVALFPPIMPVLHEDDPLQELAAGKLPKLHELRLHQGSTWPWNRAIYDHHDGGHVRMEVRALPAGPSLQDMSATGAFLLGSALALRDSMPDRINLLPFKFAEHNFYRAAQHGLEATLLWPSSSQIKVVEYEVLDLAQRLVPMAEEALQQAGMEAAETNRLMNNIRQRIAARTNGAQWQLTVLHKLRASGLSATEATQQMLERYRRHFNSHQPVSQWSTEL
ncbi:MAG: hypothetical protein CMK83_07160 [Pseudomonadales bacterium]|uniref:glutamate--cysteine ligase n=1 Tax=unclassified Ketobacter TaxID=2639109 RepID=UPI000C932582|nr:MULTISPECIES: glutamate--cysteine ligase [unclassified Ketobacter]MAA59103.1 hypothetical protein [Pseudomonadales bacterium]MEC8813832.1 hypothetical protein [Pseudomonadota bacterium]TNC88493.1 MAG: hypothetical protein CSH49_11325 [Alcanivorax sp.]HAG93413.1 hypothetical protein [Gammaproteobacteria bacterium]MAQ23984.1 hypothetical protein [Pseudomonadales bacterium]|tara:strand:+ start:33896 stop:35386 length:1491 start_codon:yes stop_codon:yes gene_type:complete